VRHAQIRAEGEHPLGKMNIPSLEASGEILDRLLQVVAVLGDLPFHATNINISVNRLSRRDYK
jgi:hypothetical protein